MPTLVVIRCINHKFMHCHRNTDVKLRAKSVAGSRWKIALLTKTGTSASDEVIKDATGSK